MNSRMAVLEERQRSIADKLDELIAIVKALIGSTAGLTALVIGWLVRSLLAKGRSDSRTRANDLPNLS